MAVTTPSLAVTRLRLRFAAASPGAAPDYTGTAWRGGLGHALRRGACRTGAPTCGGCPHLHDCDYSLAFETPRPPGETQLHAETVPQPFGLVALANGVGEQELLLSLYGTGTRFLAPLVAALERAGGAGIGPDRVRYRLQEVTSERPLGSGAWQSLGEAGATPPSPGCWPSAPAACQLRLITPLRLRRQERYVGPRDFRFSDLFSNLLRRVSALCRLYALPLETDFRGLSQRAEAVGVEAACLRWHDWTRYSSRQQRGIALGGLLGRFACHPPAEMWPYLWLGQFTQAGKGITMGLGHYEVGAA